MRQYLAVSLGCLLMVGSACVVPKKKYEAAVQKQEQLKEKLAKTRKEAADTKETLNSKIEKKERRVAELEQKIARLEKKITRLENERDDLDEKLKKAQGTLEMYESETGSLQEELDATKKELAKLREKQRQQKERLDRYRSLAKRLANTFKSGQLSVKVRDGKMVIEMSDDVLFDSGSAQLNDNGEDVLAELAKVLQDLSDREFLIAGHTDKIPVGSGRFRDNWDLSTSRATNVVRFLKEKGVSPKQLAAAGYSKFDPIADNSNEEGRAKNRRIEIVLMPKVNELPELPENFLDEENSSDGDPGS